MIGKLTTSLVVALALASQTASSQSIKTQPALDYSFAPAIAAGTRIGDHIFQNNNVRVSGPVAFGDNGQVVFYGQWSGAAINGANGRGVYTSMRVVVEEGSKVGDSLIVEVVNVRPGDLQTNRAGQVAYLATIDSTACGASSSCRALFVDRDLRAITSNYAATYVLAEDGKIQSANAGLWMKPAALASSGSVFYKVRQTLGGAIHVGAKRVKLPVIGIVDISPDIIDLHTKQAQRAAGPQNAGFTAPTSYPSCPIPTGYQYPLLWQENANAAGPINSASQQVFWQTAYRTAAGANKIGWVRKVYFASDCRAVLIALMQPNAPTAEELWTPAGLLAAFDADNGVYHFGPLGDASLPPSTSPIADGILVNARCQVLIPVTLRSAESALILATPNNTGHCR